ncbi:hypothetical protein CQA20_29455, partial [Klebsiella pneumoniae]
TITAAIPSALATGSGSETMKPMAICLIGGVLLSTVLTLFVVPCFYLLLDRFRKTITAAIPSALATGSGSETMKPMAICLIGGVLLS